MDDHKIRTKERFVSYTNGETNFINLFWRSTSQLNQLVGFNLLIIVKSPMSAVNPGAFNSQKKKLLHALSVYVYERPDSIYKHQSYRKLHNNSHFRSCMFLHMPVKLNALRAFTRTSQTGVPCNGLLLKLVNKQRKSEP